MIHAVSVEAYQAARRHAGLIDRSDRGRVVVSGKDRASYLQGLLTNDISALQPGQGCYAAYLTAQGRMITDVRVYELGDLILLVMPGDVKDSLLAKLDQFIFAEEVTLGDVTTTFGQLAVVGPSSAAIVAQVLEGVTADRLEAMPRHANLRASLKEQPVVVAQVTDTGEPGFDLFVDRAHVEALSAALRHAGAIDVDLGTADAVRVEAGVPLFHRDMDEDTIPLEAGIESEAISFTKGCYVGQEVIIRVLHRGHGRVARKLVGLTLSGAAVPAAGAVLRNGDREVGRVTSGVWSPALDRPIALGYVQRDFVEPGTVLSVDGAAATVTALPLVSTRS